MPATLERTLAVSISHPTILNFAQEQSGVPFIRDVAIKNSGAEPVERAILVLELKPDLGEAMRIALPALQPGEEHRTGAVDYRLPPGRLRQLEEAEKATLAWALEQDGEVLDQGGSPIEVLAFNEWPGARAPYSLLASFVLPNHPAIPQILQRVRAELEATTGNAAIDGYQSGLPSRVVAQVRALYDALQSYDLSYVGMPASFEKHGQKVRLPDRVLDEKLGCCLDITVLAAACLEQMGLSPLAVLIRGHAFPGVWLLDERFPEGVVEDAARIRNAVAMNHVLLFDSSTTVLKPSPPLEQAAAVARASIQDDDAFECALDIPVLRRAGFRPLPLRAAEADVEQVVSWKPLIDQEAPSSPASRPVDSKAGSGVSPAHDDLSARFKKWQEKLLDLSLRNKLLSVNLDSKQAVGLIVPDVARFEDLLAAGTAFDILPAPHLDDGSRDLAGKRIPEAEILARLLNDLDKGAICAAMGPEPLFTKLKFIDRQARSDFEEGGAHSLYIGIGFLKWFENAEAPAGRIAPVLLYPVRLEQDRNKRRFSLRRVGDDPLPNVTLVEKMRRDFGLDLSPILGMDADESGLDVNGLLTAVRAAIQRMPRWEVLDEAHLGLFSFTKFLMWKDLEDNREILLQSDVVRHIASRGGSAFAQPIEPVDPARLDERMSPAKLPAVIDADSTQLAAVASALEGRSFVLQGPPGTGKSQTITNLVAAALGAGKSVLFVSEKMAALDVVFRRLQSVGLGDFCLELHSAKSNKKQVLESLEQAWKRSERVAEVPWEERSTELAALRARLNAYAEALHRPRSLGITFHEGLGRLLALSSAPEVRFQIPDVASATESQQREWRETVAELAAFGKDVEPVAGHPWRGIGAVTWSAALQEELADVFAEVPGRVSAVDSAVSELARLLEVPLPSATAALAPLPPFLELLSARPLTPAAFGPDWQDLGGRLQALADDSRKLAARQQAVGQRWQPTFFDRTDLGALQAVFTKAVSAFPLFGFFMMMGPRKALAAEAKGQVPDGRTVLADITEILSLKAEAVRLDREMADLKQALGPAWPETGVEGLAGLLGHIDGLLASLRGLPDIWTASMPALAVKSRSADWRDALARASDALIGKHGELDAVEQRLATLLGIAPGQAWSPATREVHRPSLQAAVLAWEANLGRFRPWCLYRHAATEGDRLGLGALVEAHADGRVSADQLVDAFDRTFYGRWASAIRDSEEPLRTFEGGNHRRLAEKFAAQDLEHIQFARQVVIRTLEARLPDPRSAAIESSEPGILQRELKKKARHLPVRKLLKAIPNLLWKLKPCLLMSPLSIAQYLPADGRKFDLVVFDEASQIGTHDAIGAIARGSQVIIVGDSKQLPPTTFFTRQSDDDDAVPDENDVVELESILDEAVAKQIPQQMLGWHYRSRHDSLIDFSNRHYYEAKLHVFPSAKRHVESLGIKWHPVPDGVYMGSKKGKDARTNPREAQALVAHLVDALRRTSPGSRTFGVVTFSQVQQSLVLDLLDEARGRHPEIEPHFSGPEAVFVKNLENVQGDERDEIYFSICYAKDESGKLRMHFGPLSTAGGERRLNVAITRSRCQLRVFSTLTHDQIDLNRTSSVGAAHLRAFLEFAARQGGESKPTIAAPVGQGLLAAVQAAVRELGYESHPQVGCGNYRVDLAVSHPDRPGEYCLGIELDGLNYHSARTARDRDRLRHQVLGCLGWKMHRIWCLDWWIDRETEMKRLAAAIEAAKLAPDPAPDPVPPPAPASPTAAADEGLDAGLDTDQREEQAPVRYGRMAPAVVERPASPASAYRRAAPKQADVIDPEAFYSVAQGPAVREAIVEVVRVEGPVHVDLVARRLIGCWGLSKLTDRVRRKVVEEAHKLHAGEALVKDGDVLWPVGLAAADYRDFRGAAPDGETRDASLIPTEEIANAATWLLKQCLSLGQEDLVRETARLFGIQRVGKNVSPEMLRGLERLSDQGLCRLEGETVLWTAEAV